MTNDNLPYVHLIILNWNGKKDTLECLSSVRQITYPRLKTFVVDNGSTDESIEAIRVSFPEVSLLLTGENLGYAEGNNVGIRHAMEHGADFIFLLNNDTTVDSNVVSALVAEAVKNPNAGILGPKTYFYDRPDIINSAGGYINHETLKRGHIGYGFKEDGTTYSKVTSVEWITGCALLLNVSVLRQTGIFDPDYFLICEELDLCARVRRKGYDILFVPGAKIWHKVSAAFEGNYSPVYCFYMFRNILLYVRKNSQGGRFSLYQRLLKQSYEFYKTLEGTNDPDYRKKGFCILMGTLHFFLGIYGKAAPWIFNVKFPRHKSDFIEISEHHDLFKAEIKVNRSSFSGAPGTTTAILVTVTNLSQTTWPAFSATPICLSYHIYDEEGKTVVWDGLRTKLPKNLKKGKHITFKAGMQLPDLSGTYTLELDLVQETVAWFSKKGCGTRSVPLSVE